MPRSWGNIGFPVLYDADNDGLPYSSDGDDHVADRDGDGLLDGYEVEIGSNPAAADSDGDGLGDRYEILAGTDPNLPDTDGDGLKDGEEVGHPGHLRHRPRRQHGSSGWAAGSSSTSSTRRPARRRRPGSGPIRCRWMATATR